MYKDTSNPAFRNKFAEDIFNQKYRHEGALTWAELAVTCANDVCTEYLSDDDIAQLAQYIAEMKFIPGGRYLYYTGRRKKFFNNCYLLKAEEDNREDWAELSKKVELCLSTGGGIGVDYSVYRASGTPLHGTGGIASGPLAKMRMVNEQGRGIIQGGSRRSAIYASLSHSHGDVSEFLKMKNWYEMPAGNSGLSLGDLKEQDFNFQCPMDMTNISVNYDDDWLLKFWETGEYGKTFLQNCKQALSTGEPGFSFNFFDKREETLRNACTEVTSEDDSDVCNLGSINLSRISSIAELADVVCLATKFLLCGTLVADLPYDKVVQIRQKNRRLGLGLMGVHEWLLARGEQYGGTPELHRWLTTWRDVSNKTAREFADQLSVSRPVAVRAIAPTGTIGILAGTSTGIEPIFATAYKRRYLRGTRWQYQYVIDAAAKTIIDIYGTDPSTIETALSLSTDVGRRIRLQANIQDYVDQAISSTINLPKWGTENNNEDHILEFAKILAEHAHRLRGFTCYPAGARGGQPLVEIPYKEALEREGEVVEEFTDVCDLTGAGVCGI